MKNLILFFLILFSLKIQAQQQVSAEVRAKMKAMQEMSKKMQRPQTNTGGKITYTANGKTYTETANISTVIIDGKIGDISNDKHTVAIGDGQTHNFKKGESYACKSLMVTFNELFT